MHGLNVLTPPKKRSELVAVLKCLFGGFNFLLWLGSVASIISYLMERSNNSDAKLDNVCFMFLPSTFEEKFNSNIFSLSKVMQFFHVWSKSRLQDDLFQSKPQAIVGDRTPNLNFPLLAVYYFLRAWLISLYQQQHLIVKAVDSSFIQGLLEKKLLQFEFLTDMRLAPFRQNYLSQVEGTPLSLEADFSLALHSQLNCKHFIFRGDSKATAESLSWTLMLSARIQRSA